MMRRFALTAAGSMLLAVAALFPSAALPAAALPLNCSQFNASAIDVITFDVFAALMDTPTSLLASVAPLLPMLNASAVQSFVDDWLAWYGSFMVPGRDVFNASTQAPEPFTWVIRSGLTVLLDARSLDILPGSPTFEALARVWGALVPWPGTQDALARLQTRYAVAALSNGDAATLRNATSIFASPFAGVYSSDYPVGAFKPNARIYAQLASTFGAAHVFHVAGSPVDALGARTFGLYAALLHNEPLPGAQPCFVLANISELPAILGL